MQRTHFLRQWFNLSDAAMEGVLHDTPMFHEFEGLDAGEDDLSDESSIIRFRHLARSPQPELAKSGHLQRHAGSRGPALEERHGGRCHATRAGVLSGMFSSGKARFASCLRIYAQREHF